MNESPIQFNMWAAISAVSATLKDNVYIRRGNYKIFPNQYIVLVASPGIGKGTAIKPAHSFVKNPATNIPLANYVQDRITAAKLIEILDTGFPRVRFNNNGNLLKGKDTTCIIQADELATLLSSNDWISTLLTKIWEGDDVVYDTKSSGKKLAKDICISLIGACTQSLIKSINKNHGSEVNNGFTARTIFVFGDKKSQAITWPKGFEDYPQITTKLNNDLEMISQLHGEFSFDSTAKYLYEREYDKINKNLSEEDSDIIKNFKARQSTHILKLAMTLSAASRDDLVIDNFAMSSSITLIESILKSLDTTFGGIGDSELAEDIARIQVYIERYGTCSINDILKDNRRNITSENLTRVLNILMVSNIIVEFISSGKKFYKYIGATKP